MRNAYFALAAAVIVIFLVVIFFRTVERLRPDAPKPTICSQICSSGVQEVEITDTWDGEVYTKCICK
jgi:hypothetical protein